LAVVIQARFIDDIRSYVKETRADYESPR